MQIFTQMNKFEEFIRKDIILHSYMIVSLLSAIIFLIFIFTSYYNTSLGTYNEHKVNETFENGLPNY